MTEADARVERIRALADRVVRSHGLDLFDVQLRREAIGWVLRVVIDRRPVLDVAGHAAIEPIDQGIGILECQRVSEDLGTLLDVEDVIDHEYTLEVSSPGLDRPLRGVVDYERFRGRLAKIVVKAPVEGQTFFEGRIEGIEAETILLRAGRRQKRIPLAAVARARLEVEF